MRYLVTIDRCVHAASSPPSPCEPTVAFTTPNYSRSTAMTSFTTALASALLVLAGCSGSLPGLSPQPDRSPLQVSATNGTADTAPLFSWTPVGATSVWVNDANGRTVWGIEAGGRTLANNRYERVLIPSPVPYGAYADASGSKEETPRLTTPPQTLQPGTTYTVQVTYLGGGSGGFTGQRPVLRRGSATFTVSAPVPER